MREPRLYLSFSYSFFLHLIFVVSALLIINKTSDTKIQKTYTVSLITVPSLSQVVNESVSTKAEIKKEIEHPKETKTQKDTIKKQDTKRVEKPLRDTSVEDRISEIKAKKRLEGLASLRRNIDISDSERQKGVKGNKANSVSQGSIQGRDEYLSMVRAMVMQKWVYPDKIDKDLETIIAIRIHKDGKVTIIGVEKSSGNRLFDRSALSAINSLNVLPRPPEGIEEVGIRFKP